MKLEEKLEAVDEDKQCASTPGSHLLQNSVHVSCGCTCCRAFRRALTKLEPITAALEKCYDTMAELQAEGKINGFAGQLLALSPAAAVCFVCLFVV